MDCEGIAELRLLIPGDVAERLRGVSNVHFPELEKNGLSAELNWADVQNIAAVVTIVGGLAALPGQIAEIAGLITDHASTRGSPCTCVVEGATDNYSVCVRNENDRGALEETLTRGVVWQVVDSKDGPG